MEPKEKPTEPGWYWATFLRSKKRVIVEVQIDYGKMWAYLCGNEEPFEVGLLTDYVPCIDPLAENAT